MSIDQRANDDFDSALFKAFWRRIATWLTGKKNELLPYDEVRQLVPMSGQHDLGLTQVPIDAIIGSVGRFRDFDRAFFPTQDQTRDRWISIDKARYQEIPLPAVELYKIGEIYFVKDGNHRVSVARKRGQAYVDAYVIEVDVPFPVTQDTSLDELAGAKDQLEFLDTTNLPQIRPETVIFSTVPGQYRRLLEHIAAHRWFLGEQEKREIPYPEAVASWHDHVYIPIVELIRKQKLTKEFPTSSEADLYILIIDYQWYLREAYRYAQDNPEHVANQKLLEENPAQPVRKLAKLIAGKDWIEEFILEQDYARFMRQTDLRSLRPDADLIATIPGAYDELLEHIRVHRWYLGEQRREEVGFQEAVLSWFDNVYAPISSIISEQKIIARFPSRTKTDLYLWVIKRQAYLKELSGYETPLERVAGELAEIDPQIPPSEKPDQAQN